MSWVNHEEQARMSSEAYSQSRCHIRLCFRQSATAAIGRSCISVIGLRPRSKVGRNRSCSCRSGARQSRFMIWVSLARLTWPITQTFPASFHRDILQADFSVGKAQRYQRQHPPSKPYAESDRMSLYSIFEFDVRPFLESC